MKTDTQKDANAKRIETIIKLLELADPTRGASPEEARTAMAKAQELKTKWGIEDAALLAAQADKEGKMRGAPSFDITNITVVMYRQQRYDFDSNVAMILQACFAVKVIFTRQWVTTEADGVTPDKNGPYYSHCYILVGDVMDVTIAKALIPILIQAMWRGVRALLKARGEKWTARVGRAFYDGLTNGYIHGSEQGKARARAQAKKKDADAFAIVLVDKDNAICARAAELFPDLKTLKDQRRSGIDRDAYQRGYSEGQKMDLSGNKLK